MGDDGRLDTQFNTGPGRSLFVRIWKEAVRSPNLYLFIVKGPTGTRTNIQHPRDMGAAASISFDLPSNWRLRLLVMRDRRGDGTSRMSKHRHAVLVL
jgi:hypothetical protein